MGRKVNTSWGMSSAEFWKSFKSNFSEVTYKNLYGDELERWVGGGVVDALR